MTTLPKTRSPDRAGRLRGAGTAPVAVVDSPATPASTHVASDEADRQDSERLSRLAAGALLLAESLLRLIQPLMLGLAINDLIGSSCRGLLLFAVTHLLLLLAATSRRMLKARERAAMPDDQRPGDCALASAPVAPHRTRGWMTRLVQAVPDSLDRAVTVGGALLLLGWYDLTLIPFCLVLILPIWLLRSACEPRITACRREHQRIQTEICSAGDTRSLLRCRAALRSCCVRGADAVAIRTALTDLFALGMLSSAIVHYVSGGVSPPPAGDILAVVCYLLLFVAGLRGGCACPAGQQSVELPTGDSSDSRLFSMSRRTTTTAERS